MDKDNDSINRELEEQTPLFNHKEEEPKKENNTRCKVITGVCIVLVLLGLGALAVFLATWDWNPTVYGVVFDAGSSGTRAHVFKWLENEAKDRRIPHIIPFDTDSLSFEDLVHFAKGAKLIQTSKEAVTPGIHTIDPKDVSSYLHDLFEFTNSRIAGGNSKAVVVLFYATAGMRSIPEENQTAILNAVKAAITESGLKPKNMTQNVRVIKGEEEGLFGWLSTNYALDVLEKENQTVGVVDLGGASVENTFLPSETPVEHKSEVRTRQKTYNLYSYSFLGYGVDKALGQVLSYLANPIEDPAEPVDNPCFLEGYNVTMEVEIQKGSQNITENRTFVGKANFTGCLNTVRTILHIDAPCKTKPCSFNGVYQPDVRGIFYGISNLYYTANFFKIPSDKVQKLDTFSNATSVFCAKTWEQVTKEYPDVKEKFLRNYCFLGSYGYTLLSEGFRLNHTQENIYFVGEINHNDISWPLGAVIKNGILP